MEEFEKIIKDFTKDLLTSFPELKPNLHKDIQSICLNTEDKPNAIARLYEHTNLVFPLRFFDILYENQDMFTNEDNNLEFLPGIDFKLLWKENISDNTRVCIWKYLQLILFNVSGNLSSNESFGDTAKLFEAIDEKELKSKLEETMNSLQDIFKNINTNDEENDEENDEGNDEGNDEENDEGNETKPKFTMPNPENIHAHFQEMFDGKIGSLAKEITNETMKDMDIDLENPENSTDLFKNLLKDPKKLMGLVQSVGKKLDEKLKSGELKETELLQEASEMLKKMKDMPGMNHMENMFKNMGIPMPSGAGGRNAKMNFGAMQGKLQQQMRQAKMKERMKERINNKTNTTINTPSLTQSEIDAEVNTLMNNVFSTGESVERSTRPNKTTNSENNKPKKKKKKKKNK
tara:strand:- start:6443 stop:7654 length:1212 start_codon:yes stop_codon:yes gene_type:complete